MRSSGSRNPAVADESEQAAVPQAFDATVFRQVISNFTSGVVVVTASHQGQWYGATVSAVSSLSLDPPMLLVCLNSDSSTQEAVRNVGVFAVNILADHQGDLAEIFARRADGADKFAGLGVRLGRTGSPVLDGALAVVECEVAEVVAGGSHRVFLSRVVHAEATEGSPLAYFRGRLSALEIQRDTSAYQQIRRMVLTRALGPTAAVDLETLVERVGSSPSSVYYALTRLVGEGLMIRDVARGYLVKALDPATSDDLHDARLAIELGVARLTIGRLDQAQLAEFRRLAEQTVAHVRAGRVTDVDAFVAANIAFHEFPVMVSGIHELAVTYQRLGLSDLMTAVVTGSLEISTSLIEDHRALVDAYERVDLIAVENVAVAHNGRAKATQRAGIHLAGGSL